MARSAPIPWSATAAGCLIQIPDALLQRVGRGSRGSGCRRRATTAMTMLPPTDEATREAAVGQFEHSSGSRPAAPAGAACAHRPDRPPRRGGHRDHADDPARRSSQGARRPWRPGRSSASCSPSASRPRTPWPNWPPSRAYAGALTSSTALRSRPVRWSTRACTARRPGRRFLQGPDQSAHQVDLALIHQRFATQHLSVLEARPPLPLHRPQRRDQRHRRGDDQLDERHGGHGDRSCSARTWTRCGR